MPEKQGHDAFASGRFLASRTESRESRVRETLALTSFRASGNERAHDDDDGAATVRCDECATSALCFRASTEEDTVLHMRTRDDVGWKMGAVIQQSVGGRTTTLLIRLDDGVLGG